MANWEILVTAYDTVDKAKAALNVLMTSGIDTSNVSVLDRATLGSTKDYSHVGLWRRLFGESVWDHEAAVYGDTLKKGGALLAVRVPQDQVAKTMSILDVHQPLDVHAVAAKIGETVPVQAKALVTPPIAKADAKDPETLRLAEEQLNVGKRMFETGTTRIRRFATERAVEAEVTIHEEHAEVVRRAVSDPNYIANIDWSDNEHSVTETAEEVVVGPAEEVVVGKRARVAEEVAKAAASEIRGLPERRISFWIVEREQDRNVPLKQGVTYNGCFRVGVPVEATLFGGADVIPDSDIPLTGLNTHWRVISTNLQFILTDTDTMTRMTPSGEVEFDLLVPKIGNSKTISLALTPLALDAGFLVLIFVGQKLYRELAVALRVTVDGTEPTTREAVSRTTRDLALAKLGQADLRTTHKWTTPPGSLTLYVFAPGRATIFGSADGVPYPAGEQVYMGTEKAELSGVVDALHKAAENLRKAATAYLNDVDPTDLLSRLAAFQPQYDWARLSNLADPAHDAAWAALVTSAELQVLAFYGRKLYDTLFPAEQNSRGWMDALPPGQLVHVVWRQDSGANWIPHLPWELLYRGDANPGATIDPTQFWGLRYRLHYTAYNPPKVPSASLGTPHESCCTSLLFFGNASKESTEVKWQREVWASLSGQVKSCLVPAGTQNPKSEIVKALIDPESVSSPGKTPAAVLYLFCHYGKDPNDFPILRFGDTLDPNDILTEPELGTSILASRPLVFANACATAGTDVYSANTVTKAFFDRGCRAFIGTDCMVPSAMASRFAIIFFHFFLRLIDQQQRPMAAGEAVAQSRLFLWCQYRNIGGLLYSFLNQYELYMASNSEIRTLQRGLTTDA